jgi:16S rRNA (cytosine967-C5)-methyltransferase
MIAPARLAAYDILRSVSSGRADLPSALADARERLRDDRDGALATEIATGVQRTRAALDYFIHQTAGRPLERLDPEVLEILRLSTYQLQHLTRVPASAVVDDAVSLTGRLGKRSAAGFVNAVLRRLAREQSALRLPARPSDESVRAAVLSYLTITLSHPRWLAERWYDRLGFERAEAWMLFNNRPAPVTLRPHLQRLSVEHLETRLAHQGVRTHRGRYAPSALVVDEGNPIGDRKGGSAEWLAQDEASQLVALLTGDDPGPLVLDTCAAPGGKATAVAAATDGTLVACDVRDRRIALLRDTVRQAGAVNIRVVQADLEAGLPFGPRFSAVVVDAPCSGLGTLRRDPDIRWRRQEADLAVFAERQRRMIRHAASVVAPGGRLVYATCSSEPEENEAVVDDFLAATRDFLPIDAREAHRGLPAVTVDDRGHLRTSPDVHGLECFFGAVFERSRHL